MKMEHVITAPHGGIVRAITMAPGDVVREGYGIVFIEAAEVEGGALAAVAGPELDHIRGDLRENIDRHAFGLDENRPQSVARRKKLGYRMPRENIARLVDPGSFKEYWPLVVARQHDRNTIEELRKNTPGDGVVAGMCSINGTLFDATRSRAALVHYDYTVLAGTRCLRTGCGCTQCGRSSTPSPTPVRCLKFARNSALESSRPLSASRAGPWA